jgi:hypothetical protein
MTPDDRRRLFAAREMVECALAAVVLDALVLAVTAEHPTLGEPPEVGDPPSLRRARHLLHLARALARSIRGYRDAVDDATRAVPGEDLPF